MQFARFKILKPAFFLGLLLFLQGVGVGYGQVPIEEEWTVPLTFDPNDPNVGSIALEFGNKHGATDGFDSGIDSPAPPPPPPPSFFVFFSGVPVNLIEDFRDTQADSNAWTAVISNTISTVTSITIRWNTSIFPLGDTPGSLIIKDSFGNQADMLADSVFIIIPFGNVTIEYISPLINPPVVNFTGFPISGPEPLSVTFSEAISGTNFIDSYEWNFPGGNPSSETTAGPHSVAYVLPGRYDVSLTVCNAGGCNTMAKTEYINVGQPDILVVPTSLNFDKVASGSNDTRVLTIKNDSAATIDLEITAITPPAGTDFSVAGIPPLPFSLAPGASEQIEVSFGPTAVGDQNGDLVIESNDPDENPLAVPLSGTVVSWLVSMTATAVSSPNPLPEIANFALSIGGHPEATDGFDIALDDPAPPPSQSYYAYLAISAFPNFLLSDFREWTGAFDTDIDWMLQIVNAQDITSEVCWDSTAFPDEGIFFLVDTLSNQKIDMRQQSCAQITGNATLFIQYRVDVCVPYEFPIAGGAWYMISLPVVPEDNSVASLFPSAVSAFGWDFANSNYVQADSLDPGRAYWLLLLQADAVEVCGLPFESYTNNYTQQGWDMIGAVVDANEVVDDPDGSIISMFGWDAAVQNYVGIDPMIAEPQQGYWILVFNVPSTISVGSGSSSGLVARAGRGVQADLAAFYQLYGTLPPPPPSSSAISNQQSAISFPAEFGLSQNYPNPFNPQTKIEYALPQEAFVRIEIYNVLGQRMRNLVEKQMPAGYHSVLWEGRDDRGLALPGGVYFVRMQAGEFVSARKLLLLK